MEFYSADYHFGHHNVIEYCNRPFKNINQMEKGLIRNINEKVAANDTLIVVGDFSTKGPSYKTYLRQIIDRIKCEKIILVLGNHDELSPRDYVEYIGFYSVHTRLETNEFIINHDPSKSYQIKNKIWLTAHSHDHWKVRNNCINVGVDMWNYYPVNMSEIKECIKYIKLKDI